MEDIATVDLLKKGRMTKHPMEMTESEIHEWSRTIQERAKYHLFSIGQPLVYRKDGIMVAEFADGRVKRLR